METNTSSRSDCDDQANDPFFFESSCEYCHCLPACEFCGRDTNAQSAIIQATGELKNLMIQYQNEVVVMFTRIMERLNLDVKPEGSKPQVVVLRDPNFSIDEFPLKTADAVKNLNELCASNSTVHKILVRLL